MSVRIALAGVSGRMGRTLLEAVAADADCTLSGALDRPGSPLKGQDAGAALGTASGVSVTDQPAVALQGAQALIDFTRPEATFDYLDACVAAGVDVGHETGAAALDPGADIGPVRAPGAVTVVDGAGQAVGGLQRGNDGSL